jgi:protein-S-isoprenylcysteine O-methyltransferase Ste14
MSERQSKFGGARVHFPPPLVFLALVGAGVAVGRWMWPFAVPLAFWPRITVGIVVTLAGVALVISARIWFTRTGQSPIPWKPSPELLVKGIYHHTRNPMYLGVTTFSVRARHFARQFVDLHLRTGRPGDRTLHRGTSRGSVPRRKIWRELPSLQGRRAPLHLNLFRRKV